MAMLITVAYMILMERKMAGWIQDRVGPDRAGPKGMLQPFCDGLKLLFKEDYTPDHVDKVVFTLAPCIMMFFAITGFAIIPFAGTMEFFGHTINMQIANVDIGILYVLALGSLSVYGVVLGGWASNNKYSLLGGIRAAAQMLSYEVPLGLALLSMVMLTGTLKLDGIVEQQINGYWNVIAQPFTFLIFLICIFAETNRLPFDLPECEQELVVGYHTEYASMKFGCFFLGEYAHIIVASSMAVVLFFGGWHLPGVTSDSTTIGATLLRIGVFYAKVWSFILFYMWVRWTLPRFRFDTLMKLAWKSLVPLAMGLLIVNSLVLYMFKPANGDSALTFTAAQLAGNFIVFAGMLVVSALTRENIAANNRPLSITEIVKD